MMGRPQAEQPVALGNDGTIGHEKRFMHENQGFRQRTQVVNSILVQWPLVCGTGSLLEAHLVGRLGLAEALPGLVGCGTNEEEVWQLSQTLERQGLVILSDSIAADRGLALIQRLQMGHLGHRVLLLVQAVQAGRIKPLLKRCHKSSPLAILHVESFGSGAVIRALLSLKAGRSYLDPQLREMLELGADCQLTRRETQALHGLARGLSNKLIAAELGIKPETVRDHVSSLLSKLTAHNRTEALAKALEMGLIDR
jgi:DNA-binding NarL/FixJ family response regulator